jgi:hypothetical protein
MKGRPAFAVLSGSVALLMVIVAAGATSGQPRSGPQPLQHSAQPNPQEVRPASPDGDSPSASAGQIAREPQSRRVLGLPVDALMWIAGLLVAALLLAAMLARRPHRRAQARGGGTYGRGPGS